MNLRLDDDLAVISTHPILARCCIWTREWTSIFNISLDIDISCGGLIFSFTLKIQLNTKMTWTRHHIIKWFLFGSNILKL